MLLLINEKKERKKGNSVYVVKHTEFPVYECNVNCIYLRLCWVKLYVIVHTTMHTMHKYNA